MTVTQLPMPASEQALSPKEHAEIDEFLTPLWEVEFAQLPEAAQARFQALGGQEGSALAVARDAISYFGAGLARVPRGDFPGAFENLLVSAQQFAQLQHKDGFVVSSALAKYFEGVIAAQRGNIQAATETMAQAEQLLQQAGGLGRRYQPLLDHLKPEALFLTAIYFLQRQDYDNARVWVEQASAAAAELSGKYPKDSAEGVLFGGLSTLYRMIYDFAVALRDLNICRYDQLISAAPTFRQRASATIEALDKAKTSGTSVPPNLMPVARGIRDTLEALPTIAEVMLSVFQSTFTPDIPQLVTAKKSIQAAMNSFAEGGELAVPMLKQIQQLSQKIDNVQLLVKPTGKSIIVFGGIITALLFVPILFGVSWTYDRFHWGAPPLQVAGLALLAAAIAGFGASALKLLPAVIGANRVH